ncbi:polyprenyl synthetase family protein [Lactobacillus sp. LC28-10]|uniref:Polyprenyl synthetase family protein n=1 Tax=Secundilactobacillus angelensis TaxID=2722706 RepID=A0ABX1L005_9LACO|nr:polyprenyl synthetase family protein [Secundilactobacillus angelensis]MCH5463175.1 polyprenyl synthetase family protein [Secundilactobacillus angelensis]NLR19532.1 polyprenyl synthetase family protein [Secundilactobacillus angelensis]
MVHKLWHQFPQVETQLKALQPYLVEAVKLPNQPIHHQVLALLQSGGKLLRPGFFYLFSEFGDQHDESVLRAGAAALELLHVATLIHDDVIDQSPLRRGITTIHTLYGSRNAIYAGDFLFTIYFKEVLKTTQDMAELRLNIQSMRDILVGELEQMKLNYKRNVTEEDYFREISGKTAELFWLSCRQGAVLSHSNDEVARLAGEIGMTIGKAYQILDDILDYGGQSKKTKKPVLEDLKSGVYSLPLILAMKEDKTAFKAYLAKKERMTAADLQAVSELVLHYRGVEKAQSEARILTRQALDLIDQLPECSAKADLKTLTTLLLQRDE